MERQEVLPRDAIPSIDDPSFARSYFGGEFLTAFEAPGFDFERRDGRLWGMGRGGTSGRVEATTDGN